ncbi:MAG: hypothetical protein Q7K43_00595, partial [Candidatus Woesearchaeota archaeon]|nr:hypothetical protein [Candidatus Woesearchaeota archaeon]
MKKYPTKEEIITTPMTFDQEVIDIVLNWKTSIWKESRKISTTKKEKFKAIKQLLEKLAEHHKIKDLKVEWSPDAFDCHYSTLTNKITLDNRLSIITALHEFAHILKQDKDELYACRWSIWLFMQTFPITFKSLIWKGHMLIKPASSECADD